MNEEGTVNEHIWESFDSLWQTIHRLNHRVTELETRLAEIESGTIAQDRGATSRLASTDELETTRKIA